MSMKEIESAIRERPLTERLQACMGMIARMCSEGRPPKMTIPVQEDDEDVFITTTLKDALEQLNK